MCGRDQVAERTLRLGAHLVVAVSAAGRAGGQAARRIQLDIGRQVGREVDGIARLFASFEGKLVGRAVKLGQVVDAGAGLRPGAGAHKVGNGNRRQQADDGHDDHDFHQREPRPVGGFGRFHGSLVYYLRGVNQATNGL